MAIERVRSDLHRVLDRTRTDLDRIELLAAAMSAFSNPVPDYKPSFQHMNALALDRHEVTD